MSHHSFVFVENCIEPSMKSRKETDSTIQTEKFFFIYS